MLWKLCMTWARQNKGLLNKTEGLRQTKTCNNSSQTTEWVWEIERIANNPILLEISWYIEDINVHFYSFFALSDLWSSRENKIYCWSYKTLSSGTKPSIRSENAYVITSNTDFPLDGWRWKFFNFFFILNKCFTEYQHWIAGLRMDMDIHL